MRFNGDSSMVEEERFLDTVKMWGSGPHEAAFYFNHLLPAGQLPLKKSSIAEITASG